VCAESAIFMRGPRKIEWLCSLPESRACIFDQGGSPGDQHISPNRLFTAIHHIHGFPSPGTFVVMRFEKNSLIMVPPAFPAIPMAALVKTSPIPRSAWG
jgi:hypothetical protein